MDYNYGNSVHFLKFDAKRQKHRAEGPLALAQSLLWAYGSHSANEILSLCEDHLARKLLLSNVHATRKMRFARFVPARKARINQVDWQIAMENWRANCLKACFMPKLRSIYRFL